MKRAYPNEKITDNIEHNGITLNILTNTIQYLSLIHISVIVSATNILESVKDGEIVTVDASRGVIYRGSTRVL